MKNYPLTKYRFTKEDNMITAASTFAGKEIVGHAKLDPRDTFDEEYGKRLAAVRCNERVAEKRAKRAHKKFLAAQAQLQAAQEYFWKMSQYVFDADAALGKARQLTFKTLNRH